MEKQLPQNVDAEASVLGSILIDPAALVEVAYILEPQDFYREAHRTIYSAMLDLWKAGERVDYMTVVDELARCGKLEGIGGIATVSALGTHVPTSRNAKQYARIVERCAVLRRLIDAAGEIAAVAYDEPDADEAIATAETLLATATLRHNGNDSTTFAGAIDTFLSECHASLSGEQARGVMTGIDLLDQHLLGLKPGELMYICGRPGSGKSAYAGAIAAYNARDVLLRGDGGCVEWVSLEMGHVQQAKRLITSWASVNGRIVRAGFRRPDGSIDEGAYEAVRAHALRLRETLGQTLRLYDKPLTLAQLKQHITRAVLKRGCRLAIVDYIGLIDGDDPRQGEYERISAISRQLKQLALSLHIPIICLVQLNRECEKRLNKRPMLSDLRSSGGLEQDADVVLGVYRGAYYNPQLAKLDDHFRQLCEIVVLKVREGVANVTIPTRFESEYTRPGNWPSDWAWETYRDVRASDDSSEEQAA